MPPNEFGVLFLVSFHPSKLGLTHLATSFFCSEGNNGARQESVSEMSPSLRQGASTFLTHSFDLRKNWEKAKAIVEEIINAEGMDACAKARVTMSEASETCMVLEMSVEPRVLMEVDEKGVKLTALYLCDPRVQRSSTSEVWERLLDRFLTEDDISFAYVTQRSFNNLTEGKQATGAGAARTDPGAWRRLPRPGPPQGRRPGGAPRAPAPRVPRQGTKGHARNGRAAPAAPAG